MVLDSLSSPYKNSFSFHKQTSGRDGFGSWSTLLERHRFLLTTLVLLGFLCTIYLYFAVTLGASSSCSNLSGAEEALCQAKSSMSHIRKLKSLR